MAKVLYIFVLHTLRRIDLVRSKDDVVPINLTCMLWVTHVSLYEEEYCSSRIDCAAPVVLGKGRFLLYSWRYYPRWCKQWLYKDRVLWTSVMRTVIIQRPGTELQLCEQWLWTPGTVNLGYVNSDYTNTGHTNLGYVNSDFCIAGNFRTEFIFVRFRTWPFLY